ncbi:hypothetical protein E7M82_08000 [Campylobacter jejuni]|uniref:hypothetical protein n=1 Tax=Campylobacter jejuni TaxID=197 RepID=UPI00069B9784|nr:hypothetical protein [Campylobacter jejuni]ALW06047.1 hypothetical protein RC03_02640 [Campylobacter jejuni]ALW42108.1 hypothetical protein RC24_08675 [Campylobacter jejuni]EAK7806194.1 hypothetical protein [Campylobacter jejuni]EAK7918536.1 hypothetical protein [Campylobacter jejuni]EAK8172268.1 hypothetical protein [Campylobacter jejuni]
MAKKPFFIIETIQLRKIYFEKINQLKVKNKNIEMKPEINSSVIKIGDMNYYLRITIFHYISNNNQELAKSEISLEAKFSIQDGYEKEYKRIITNVLEILYTKGTEILNSTYQKAYLPINCYEFATLNEPEDKDII